MTVILFSKSSLGYYSVVRSTFTNSDCSIARSLSAIGDIWSFLIIRDTMFGLHRFSDYHASLNIAKNILSNRLSTLVDEGMLEKRNIGEQGQRFEYHLTKKGRELFPVMIALRQWGDRWVEPENGQMFALKDKYSKKKLPTLKVKNAEGKVIQYNDLIVEL